MAIEDIKEALRQAAITIRDERMTGANTANRVGSLFLALVESFSPVGIGALVEIFLRKDCADATKFLVQFFAGLEAGLWEKGGKDGSKLHEDGLVEAGRLQVNGHAEFRENLSSEEFISGFTAGKGWAMMIKEYINAAGVTEKRSVLELDDLIVRGTLRVFEFIVSQMLGENDNRTFTGMMEVDHYDAATGKVWLKTQDGKLYNTFRKDDIIIVQQYNGMPSEDNDYYVTKQYELLITEAGVGDMSLKEERLDWVTFTNFSTVMEGGTPEKLITEGDTFVRIDNLTDTRRKGIIQLMTVGENTPYMDVIYGRKTDPDNALKARFGNLEGIYNTLFGWLTQFGAYIINLYAIGEYRIAHTGEDMADKIEMLRGTFRTYFSEQRFDMTEDDNFLTNATFGNELQGWIPGVTETEFYTVDGLPIYLNRNIYSGRTSFCGLAEYNDKSMLRLLNSSITQPNVQIRKPGTHKEYAGAANEWTDNYKEVQDTLYLSLRFFCAGAGTLEFGFVLDGVPVTDVDGLPYVVMDVSAGSEAIMVQKKGTWNGTGDFVIKTTGDVYIDLLTLTDDPLSTFKVETSTRIEQDAAHIALLGNRTDNINRTVTDLGIDLNAAEERISIYATKADNTALTVDRLGVELNAAEAQLSIYAAKTSVLEGYFASGVVMKSDFATMFSEAVDANTGLHRASVGTYVMRNSDGSLESGVKVKGEQISLEGVTTVNKSFSIDLSGNVRMRGYFETSGSGSRIVISPNDASLSLYNDEGGLIADLSAYQQFGLLRLFTGGQTKSCSIGPESIHINENGYTVTIRPSLFDITHVDPYLGNSQLRLTFRNVYAMVDNVQTLIRKELSFYCSHWPTSKDSVGIGEVYLDGSTLKVRTS